MEKFITAADVAEIKELLRSINANLDVIAANKAAGKTRKKEPPVTQEVKAPEPVKYPKKEWSFEEVRGALAAKAATAGGKVVRDLIEAFGGSKLSDIPPEKFNDLMEALKDG